MVVPHMRGGDLANEVVPRLGLVFEDALAFTIDRGGFEKDMKRKRYADAIDRWDINPMMAHKIWDVYKRLNWRVDVITFLDEREVFGDFLFGRLSDLEELPIAHVIATTPDKLARKLEYIPDLARIYDPDKTRTLRWGTKGRHITDVNQLGL